MPRESQSSRPAKQPATSSKSDKDSVLVEEIHALSLQLGIEVRRLRSERKMTQATLAASAGLDPNYIGMVERGERRITLYNAWRIASGLGISVSELVLGLPARNRVQEK